LKKKLSPEELMNLEVTPLKTPSKANRSGIGKSRLNGEGYPAVRSKLFAGSTAPPSEFTGSVKPMRTG